MCLNITCQDFEARASQEGWVGCPLSETGMEVPDQGGVVMLGERVGRGAARRRGRKGSMMHHQGEKRGLQVPELESSGSKESCWQQKLTVGADQGWQVSPQRKGVCGEAVVVVGVVVVLASLCAPQSYTSGKKSHCQTKFCTGAVQLSQLP